MKLFCSTCGKDQIVAIQPAGTHTKGVCSVCTRYLKFLNKEEVKEILDEEDKDKEKKEQTTLTRWHKQLGEVTITEDCIALNESNHDPDTMFVEHEGEVKEVTKEFVFISNHTPVDTPLNTKSFSGVEYNNWEKFKPNCKVYLDNLWVKDTCQLIDTPCRIENCFAFQLAKLIKGYF